MMETLWVCPICREKLTRLPPTFGCSQGHSYDIAKEGYVNLLLVNQKGSPSPGDSKEMLISRRNFLEKGYYAPLSDRINHIIAAQRLPYSRIHSPILDAGCGEGYYIERLRQHLTQQGKSASVNAFYGLDISKEAVRLAAQKYKAVSFAVASLHQALPFPDASLDVLFSIFAPRNAPEFARVLRPGGIVLAAIPAEGHLSQLQEALRLGRIKGEKEQTIIEAFQGMFTIAAPETLRYVKTIDHADILNLLKMIPTGWQLSEEAWTRAHALPHLDIEFAFTLVVLTAKAAQANQNDHR